MCDCGVWMHGMWWHYSFPERSTMVPFRKLLSSKPEERGSLIHVYVCYEVFCIGVKSVCEVWWHYSFPERSTLVLLRKLRSSKPEERGSLTCKHTHSFTMIVNVYVVAIVWCGVFMMRFVTNLRTPSDRHFITGELRLNFLWHTPTAALIYLCDVFLLIIVLI